MPTYIEREALMKRMEERLASLRKEFGNYDHYTDGFEEGCVAVEDADAADVVERKRGEWKWDEFAEGYYCPHCTGIYWKSPDVPSAFKFCPNCGADMREVDHAD